jgi:hypothetical protein
MSDHAAHPYRPDVPPPIVVRLPIVARMRIIDSVVIPFGVMLAILVPIAVAAPATRRFLVPFALALLAGGAAMLAALLRRCVLELRWPYRTLRWIPPGSREARELELDDLAEVTTVVEIANDTAIHLVAFALRDGRRVALCDDVNYAFGARDAERLAQRVRTVVARAALLRGRG